MDPLAIQGINLLSGDHALVSTPLVSSEVLQKEAVAPEALVVDIQLRAFFWLARAARRLPAASRLARRGLARLKELRAGRHINSDAAAPATSPVRRAEPAVTFEPQSPLWPLWLAGALDAPAAALLARGAPSAAPALRRSPRPLCGCTVPSCDCACR